MCQIAYFDLEINPEKGQILDIGCIRSDEAIFHQNSVPAFLSFVSEADYLCGHNIFRHDLQYLRKHTHNPALGLNKAIDTLLLSPLLFPKRPYHRLTKDDKLQTDELNNPVNDAKKARHLFYDEIYAFNQLEEEFKTILHGLLRDQAEFECFFQYLDYSSSLNPRQLEQRIRQLFSGQICNNADIGVFMQQPISLAYTLALVNCHDRHSIPPGWVLKNYPEVQAISFQLQNTPCTTGCTYCDAAFDPYGALQRYFGYTSFRSYGDVRLQEAAVRAAIQNKSLLTIFPTGGGKSITFQLPALMSGENTGALTIVISPLQSLMKEPGG